jgi:hypothetical protein
LYGKFRNPLAPSETTAGNDFFYTAMQTFCWSSLKPKTKSTDLPRMPTTPLIWFGEEVMASALQAPMP